MSLRISHELGEWDRPDKLPNGGIRIAVNGERIHRFDPDRRPMEAKQDWGPKYVGVYPALDFGRLLGTTADVVASSSMRQETAVSLCECAFSFVFERLDETYVRLAVRGSGVVPEGKRGYLVTVGSLTTELTAAVDRLLSDVAAESTEDAEVASDLQAQRDTFVDAVPQQL